MVERRVKITIEPVPDAQLLWLLRPPKDNISILLFIIDKSNISSILKRIKKKISFIELDTDAKFKENGPEYFRGGVEFVDIKGKDYCRRKQQDWWSGAGIYYMNNLEKSLDYNDRHFNDFYRAIYSLTSSSEDRITHFCISETTLFVFLDKEQCEQLLKRFNKLSIINPFQIIKNILI